MAPTAGFSDSNTNLARDEAIQNLRALELANRLIEGVNGIAALMEVNIELGLEKNINDTTKMAISDVPVMFLDEYGDKGEPILTKIQDASFQLVSISLDYLEDRNPALKPIIQVKVGGKEYQIMMAGTGWKHHYLVNSNADRGEGQVFMGQSPGVLYQWTDRNPLIPDAIEPLKSLDGMPKMLSPNLMDEGDLPRMFKASIRNGGVIMNMRDSNAHTNIKHLLRAAFKLEDYQGVVLSPTAENVRKLEEGLEILKFIQKALANSLGTEDLKDLRTWVAS